MAIATTVQLQVAVSPFPTANEPAWDPALGEWVLTDSDGIEYFGNSPGECCRQFVAALHAMSQHARRSPYGAEDLLAYRAERYAASTRLAEATAA